LIKWINHTTYIKNERETYPDPPGVERKDVQTVIQEVNNQKGNTKHDTTESSKTQKQTKRRVRQTPSLNHTTNYSVRLASPGPGWLLWKSKYLFAGASTTIFVFSKQHFR